MWPGDLERLIKGLNPRLKIVRGHDLQENRAGLYHWANQWEEDGLMETRSMGNWELVCGVSVNWMPERTIKEDDGRHIWKRGWREVLELLRSKQLIRVPAEYGGKYDVLRFGTVKKIHQGHLVSILP